MFRSASYALRAWWTAATADILGGDLPPSDYREDDPAGINVEYFRSHPHRADFPSRMLRRAGSVPERPALCVSPVRHDAPSERRTSLPR
jgi:hypothetical protein